MQSDAVGWKGSDVPDTLESARRWSGYVCPDCRFVFRVPRDHDGKGIVCPSCRRLLKIPTSADATPPLLAPLRRTSPEEPAAAEVEDKRKIKKRRRGRKAGENLAWERNSGSSASGRGERSQMRMFLIGGAVLLGLVTAGVVVSMNGGRIPEVRTAAPGPALLETRPPSVDPAAGSPVSDAAFLAEAEPLARKFLSATRVEEILPLVRDPATAEPRMRRFYQDDGIKPVGLSQFHTTGEILDMDGLRSVGITTGDFDDRSLVFEQTPEGLRIDWESWAGWSEIAWDEFLTKKPTEAKVFRVTLSVVEYYNFHFSDEDVWQSYRLESPDHQHSIYGYVEKGGILDQRVRPNADVKSVALMLSLKFPANSTSNDQVEIEAFVSEGWVERKSE